MSEIRISANELMTCPNPLIRTVCRLIEAGAPVRWENLFGTNVVIDATIRHFTDQSSLDEVFQWDEV